MSFGIPPGFRNLGDWLIWRATGIFGDFRMPVCTSIILNEGERDRWKYSITYGDIRRILARYKEHVSFWNISIDVIRAELSAFAQAVNRDYFSVASEFDSLQAKRFPPET